MSVSSLSAFLLTLVLYGSAAAITDGVDTVSVSGSSGDGGVKGLAPPSRVGPDSVVFHPSLDSYFPLNLLAAFPEDLEISDYCVDLLHIFGQRYVTYVNCLVSSARPVKVCLNCFERYDDLYEIYKNISQAGPVNVSCKDSLLRSDRLMLVYMLYDNLELIWTTSGCERCLHNSNGLHTLTNDTLIYMVTLNQSLGCFEKYQQNHSELCQQCKSTYKGLSKLYGAMQENNQLCIDIEDSMNMTRKLWSKNFNCSSPHEETVPVIAVSSFMLFLPIIFYLSSFLHSEQKKRKLIHPKRAKSKTTLMNIQDKLS